MISGTRSKCVLVVAVWLVVLGATSRAAAQSITVGWEWAPIGAEVGYTVHVGVQSGSYTEHFDVGSGTVFTFPSANAGQRYCFAVSAYLVSSRLEGPNSNEACGYSDAPPTLVNPGDRTSAVGEAVTLQLQGFDPNSQPLTYSATGLPPGLALMASTGFISGAGSTAGTYSVTARVSDGTLTESQPFTWTMTTAPGDTARPTVAIATPTTAATYPTTSSTINLTGSAGDNVGVTRVTWTNDRGGSGVASGTNSWSITGITLKNGVNNLVVTAVDAAGNQATASLAVTRSTTTADTTKPTATISTPTTGTTFWTTVPTINLTGTAADNVGVTQITWANDRGGSGNASGTTSWAISSIPLVSGSNLITVTARDAASNTGIDTLTVTYSETTPAPTTVTLTAAPGSSWKMVLLTWTNASWPSVDVYRNNVKIKNLRNNGSTSDTVPSRGRYDYQICAPGSTTVCSNVSSIDIQ